MHKPRHQGHKEIASTKPQSIIIIHSKKYQETISKYGIFYIKNNMEITN